MSKIVKVEGEVVVKDGTGTALEFYEAEFVVDDAVENENQARAMIQNGLLGDKLRRTIDGYKRWRTCAVVSMGASQEAAPDSDLDKALLEATKLGCVPENIENYRRPDYKLKALVAAIDNHKKAKKPKDAFKDEGYVD